MVGRSIDVPYTADVGSPVLFVTILGATPRRDNGTGADWGLPRKYCPGWRLGAHHPHAALRAIEGARAACLEAAVRARQAGSRTDGREPRLLRLPETESGGQDLLVERAEHLLRDPVRVAAQT